jgi:hypothetical protein
MRNCGEPNGARHLPDDLGQYLGRERQVRRDSSFGMDKIAAIQAEDCVEVDETAPLELGHLDIRELHPRAVSLCELVQATAEGDGGAPPQLRRVSVPHDGRGVVVTVRA